MTTYSTTYSANATWTAPANLVAGSVNITVAGAGYTSIGSPGSEGCGAVATATVPGTPTSLTIALAYHTGGSGGGSAYHGYSSTAVLQGATLLVEAGGAGGLGGGSDGGNGGTPIGQNAPFLGGLSTGAGQGGSPSRGGSGNGDSAVSSFCGGGGGGYYGGGAGVSIRGGEPGGGGGYTYTAATLTGVSINASNQGSGYVIVQWTIIPAPGIPSLSSPSNASYADPNGSGVTLKAVYNATAGDNLAFIAARLSIDGGSYLYWNGVQGAGLLFNQSSPVWTGVPSVGAGAAPGGTFGLTINPGILADTHVYAWSFACEDSVSSLQGSFAPDFVFTAAAAPGVAIVSPLGSVGTATPLVSWVDTLGSGDKQISYRYMIYPAATTSPGAPGYVYDSGIVPTSDPAPTSFVLPSSADLANSTTYYGYLQIQETGPLSSAWVEGTFTVALAGPATPTLTVAQIMDPTTGMPEPQITVVGNDQLLSFNDAGFVTSVGSWVGTNCSLTLSSEAGNPAMLITAN